MIKSPLKGKTKKIQMKEQEVIDLMESATSASDWNAKILQVLQSHNGRYPAFWNRIIIDSGLLQRVAKSWTVVILPSKRK